MNEPVVTPTIYYIVASPGIATNVKKKPGIRSDAAGCVSYFF